MAVIFLDLDGFNQINDSLGHKIGDRILQVFAENMKRVIPEECKIYRWAGDEFIIIMP